MCKTGVGFNPTNVRNTRRNLKNQHNTRHAERTIMTARKSTAADIENCFK